MNFVRDAVGIYVAAPFEDRFTVRDEIHPKLRSLGFEPTSRWVNAAQNALTPETAELAIAQNDSDIARASVMLVVPQVGRGAETFCELRLACSLDLPVVYVRNRDVLSMYRSNVVMVTDLEAAYAELQRMFA